MNIYQKLMTLNVILFGPFEMIYRITNEQQFHTIAISLLISAGIFAVYNIADLLGYLYEKFSHKKV